MSSPKKYPIRQELEYIVNSEVAHKFIRPLWDKRLLNTQTQIMAFFISIDNQTVGYHAAFMRKANYKFIKAIAIDALACSVILVSNRSSGNLKPSPADIAMTKRIKGALTLIGVKLLDHLIIDEKTFLSMSDEGLM